MEKTFVQIFNNNLLKLYFKTIKNYCNIQCAHKLSKNTILSDDSDSQSRGEEVAKKKKDKKSDKSSKSVSFFLFVDAFYE